MQRKCCNINSHGITRLMCIQLIFQRSPHSHEITNHNGAQKVNVAFLLAHENKIVPFSCITTHDRKLHLQIWLCTC